MRKVSRIAGAIVLLTAGLAGRVGPAAEEKTKADPAALERTRKTVRMLDDVYKTTVVLITDKYVNNKKDFPAGSAAIALFGQISKKGWHEVRLLDATGEPYNRRNVAQDDFEKEGIKQLRDGKDYFEQVVQKNGKPHLRAITAIPVVMDKCLICHPHYEDAKKGAAIGALSYTLPIE